jgi:hypothetical protein
MNIITELRNPPYSATLKELGEIAGVSDSCISKWESQENLPSYGQRSLEKFRDALREADESALPKPVEIPSPHPPLNEPDTGNTPFHVISNAIELAFEYGLLTDRGIDLIAQLIYDDAPNQPDELQRFQLEFVALRLNYATTRKRG